MTATSTPQLAATIMSRRSGLVLSPCAVMGLDWPDEYARPLHQRHHIEQDHQSGERERDGDRPRAPGALLRLGEHDALVVIRRLVHGDFGAQATNRARSPSHPRSISSIANNRNRYKIEKAKRCRQARSTGRRSRSTWTASTSMIAPVTTDVMPYSGPE